MLCEQITVTEKLINRIYTKPCQPLQELSMEVLDESDTMPLNILRDQMCDLADFYIGMALEKLKRHQDGFEEKRRFYTERMVTFESLVNVGRLERAQSIAAGYYDWEALVQLCLDFDNHCEEQIPNLIRKYEKPFAYKLYEYYVKKEKYQALLGGPHAHQFKDLLQQFFKEHKFPHLSWLHDLFMGDYIQAANRLFDLVTNEESLSRQKTMLSISKLSGFTGYYDQYMGTAHAEAFLNVAQHHMLAVNLQLNFKNKFLQIIREKKIEADLAEKCELVQKKVAPDLDNPEKLGFIELYQSTAARLLQDKAATLEDFVDLVTLGNDQHYHAELLHVLAYTTKVSSEQVEAMQRSIWRRIYLHDSQKVFPKANLDIINASEVITKTAMYSILVGIKSLKKDDKPLEAYLCTPDGALYSATIEMLQMRFLNLNYEKLQAVDDAFQKENEDLLHAISNYHLAQYLHQAIKMAGLKDELQHSLQTEMFEM